MMFFYTCLAQMPNLTARFHERISSWLDSSSEVLETFAEWMQCHQFLVVAAFSTCYFAVTFAVAHRRPFGFDELFTYYISTLPSVDAIFTEVGKGVDHHPPSYFLLMRAASGLWPDPHVSFRIPSIVGMWLLCVCLFVFVARRTSAVYGTLAMLAPCMTGIRVWVTDARPYGPSVGLLAMGFVAWQLAATSSRRLWPLILLAVAIAGAISTSYYATVALVPLGIAELVRTAERRRIDFPMWLTMCAGSSVSLLYLPAVTQSVGGFASDGWARPRLGVLLTMYGDFFQPTMWFWLGCLLLIAVLLIVQRWAPKQNGGLEFELPAAEAVLGVGLLLLPVLGLAVAYAVTKMITARYVISTVTGFSILLSFAAFRASRGSAAIGLAITAVALFASTSNWYAEWHAVPQGRNAMQNASTLLDRAPEDTVGLPVVFESPILLFELSHYADPAVTGRCVFLADSERSLSYSGVRYTGRGLTSLQRYAPLRVDQYARFRKANPRFLLYESPWLATYVLPRLLDEGADLRLLGRQGEGTLYLVQ